MNSPFLPPPITTINGGGSTSDTLIVTQPQYNTGADVITGQSSPSSSSPSSSIVIVIIVVASAIIVSATIYLILRFLSRGYRRTFQTFSVPSTDDVVTHNSHNSHNNANSTAGCFEERHVRSNSLLDSLPLFTFGSVTGNLSGVECAVCLSKFETQDQLRLLPLCCHAFHARCIDTWLASNLTCPLCRSSVNPTESEVLSKILLADDVGRNDNGNNNGDGGSFRIEIGSVSRRHGRSDSADGRRSYSIGSFEYIVDDGYEVSVDSTHRRGPSECTSVDKESVGVTIPAPPGESLAGDVTAGRSWLRDYVDRLGSFSFSSRTMSFRSSGRFFAGSSRRSDVVVPIEDLEANHIGEEISELFRWLSGI